MTAHQSQATSLSRIVAHHPHSHADGVLSSAGPRHILSRYPPGKQRLPHTPILGFLPPGATTYFVQRRFMKGEPRKKSTGVPFTRHLPLLVGPPGPCSKVTKDLRCHKARGKPCTMTRVCPDPLQPNRILHRLPTNL